jgi:hypothetical protein
MDYKYGAGAQTSYGAALCTKKKASTKWPLQEKLLDCMHGADRSDAETTGKLGMRREGKFMSQNRIERGR